MLEIDCIAKRKKIFIDYLRNTRGATAVAAYSTRARKNAPVSVPVAWKNLNASLRPDAYNIQNLPEFLSRQKKDPWSEFNQVVQSLKSPAK